MTDECWVFIEDYPNYMVSNHGRVLNWKRGRLLKQTITDKGYIRYKLCDKGREQSFYAHRLVAIHFVPNPCAYNIIDHKDDNPLNNHHSNLIWCDYQYNNEKSLAKSLTLRSPKGEKVEVYNLSQFCRENKLLLGNMTKLGVTRDKHRGWSLWK